MICSECEGRVRFYCPYCPGGTHYCEECNGTGQVPNKEETEEE